MGSEPRGISREIYTPLPSPRSIRLLAFRSPDSHSALSFELETWDLDDERLEFTALSYCWGTERSQHPIWVNSVELLPHSSTLYTFLRRCGQDNRLRASHFWIDLLCINQNDGPERSIQVSIMSDIYARAKLVAVWLDEPGSSGSAIRTFREMEMLAFNIASRTQSSVGGGPVHDDQANVRSITGPSTYKWSAEQMRLAEATHQFRLSPCFTRTWTLQEVLFSRNVEYMDPYDSISGSQLAITLERMAKSLFEHLENASCQNRTSASASLRHLYRLPPPSHAGPLHETSTTRAASQKSLIFESTILHDQLSKLPYIFRRVYIRDPNTKIWFWIPKRGQSMDSDPDFQGLVKRFRIILRKGTSVSFLRLLQTISLLQVTSPISDGSRGRMHWQCVSLNHCSGILRLTALPGVRKRVLRSYHIRKSHGVPKAT